MVERFVVSTEAIIDFVVKELQACVVTIRMLVSLSLWR